MGACASRGTARSTSPTTCSHFLLSSLLKPLMGDAMHVITRLVAEANDRLPQAERGDEGTASPAAAQGLPQCTFVFMVSEKQLGALRTSATFAGAEV